MTFEDLTAAMEDFSARYSQDVSPDSYFGFPLDPLLQAEQRLLSSDEGAVAYFSMEYGLAPSIYNTFALSRPLPEANQFYSHEVFSNYWLCDYLFNIQIDKMLDIPIYGGGLGVLAGDTIKTAADGGFAFVGVGILWNKGYFKQKFWYKHGQIPEEMQWDPFSYPGLIPLKPRVILETREGLLHLRLWKYYVYSYDRRFVCPLILLDSNVEENPTHLRRLTDQLYRSDDVWWKIFQRVILGIGGMKALRMLGYRIAKFHLNEGHAAFALLEYYDELDDKSRMDEERQRFIFTCHTPVAAGHDRFLLKDVQKILPEKYDEPLNLLALDSESVNQVNLTYMALRNCPFVNAVAQKHGEVMRIQFPDFADKIESITNGVHVHTWVSEPWAALFDRYPETLGDWRQDPGRLALLADLKEDENFRREVFEAHQEDKRNLLSVLRYWRLKDDVLTIGWARRIAGYKRPSLIFHKVDRLVALAEKSRGLQILLAGKAHPNDDIGAAHIDEILDHIDQLNPYKDKIKVLILENYDTYFGKLLTSSVDVWLNNPLPPFEASGTSGMKAILNGVLQLTTLDGWVVEAEKDDLGWIFGYRHTGSDLGKETELRLDEDSEALYATLGDVVELYERTISQGQVDLDSPWIDKMIHCLQRSAYFNTHRMVQEYDEKFWKLRLTKR